MFGANCVFASIVASIEHFSRYRPKEEMISFASKCKHVRR